MIDGIYAELKSRGFIRNHAEFATKLLGRNARHFDYLRCTGALPSIETLAQLGARLHAVARGLRDGGRWIEDADSLEEMADTIWAEIRRRGLRPRSAARNPLRAPMSVLEGLVTPDSSVTAR